MAAVESRPAVQPGEPAPDFTLPAVEREGTVSLADYRGKSPLLLALFRGVYCPFCRRAITGMSTTREKLQAMGIDALGIVTTRLEHARLYFRYFPTRLPLVADPELATHRAYGLPRPEVTPELMQVVQSVRINPTGELPEPLPIAEVDKALDRLDDFEPTGPYRPERDFGPRTYFVMQTRRGRQVFPQSRGQFLVDREGIVRWANVEYGREGLAGLGTFPTDEELLAAARALPK